MYCNACGKVIPDDARLCSYCGQPVAATAAQLVRPRHSRRIAGVCLGLSRRFGWNVTLLRIAWVLLFFFAGTGGLLYLILWIVMPSEA